MMSWIVLMTVAVGLGIGQGPGATSPDAAVTVLRAARMLDVKSGRYVENAAVLLRGRRIEASGPAARLRVPAGATTVDLGDATLLPGLIDAHVHLAWAPPSNATPATSLAGSEEARATLLAGFTTVRNPGSTGRADILLRDAIADGRLPGPRILAAGPALGVKGGVCDRVFAGEGVAIGPTGFAAKVREIVADGAEVVKICTGGGVLASPEDVDTRELSDPEIRAVVAEAHRLGRKVAAHAQGPAAIAAAVRDGVDSIEHGALIDSVTAQLLRERRVYLVPTLYRLEWSVESAMRAGAARADIERLQKSKALAAADLLGWSDRIGSLEPGHLADIIAVRGDPLADVGMLEQPLFVMKDGRVYLSPSGPVQR